MNQERTSGQYKLESVKMYSSIRDDFIEISDFVGELNIYEDMFNNTISGNIIIEDMFNMIGKFPIVGHEDVTILLDTPDSDDEMELIFQVYKLSDYSRSAGRISSYTLNLISKEYILNNLSNLLGLDSHLQRLFQLLLVLMGWFHGWYIEYCRLSHST